MTPLSKQLAACMTALNAVAANAETQAPDMVRRLVVVSISDAVVELANALEMVSRHERAATQAEFMRVAGLRPREENE